MLELKPCPFCGGEVFLSGTVSGRCFIIYHEYPCNCYFYSFEVNPWKVMTSDEAIKAWNGRIKNDTEEKKEIINV